MTLEKSYTITVDDDPLIARLVERYTRIKSMAVESAGKLLRKASNYNPIALFIDVHLDSDSTGIDLIPELRQLWPYTPIIVITSDPNSDLIGQALAAGANDFVRKPLDSAELCGRLQARLGEAAEKMQNSVAPVGDIEFNYKQRYLVNNGEKTYISPIETELLKSLVDAGGMVVPRQALKRRLWGDIKVSDNALDRRISELRKAIKQVNSKLVIRSVYGEGIVLRAND